MEESDVSDTGKRIGSSDYIVAYRLLKLSPGYSHIFISAYSYYHREHQVFVISLPSYRVVQGFLSFRDVGFWGLNPIPFRV